MSGGPPGQARGRGGWHPRGRGRGRGGWRPRGQGRGNWRPRGRGRGRGGGGGPRGGGSHGTNPAEAKKTRENLLRLLELERPAAQQGIVRVAVQGCGHGQLDHIYELVLEREQKEGKRVDLVCICGDFQAIRDLDDMLCVARPEKYHELGHFWEYYQGRMRAPIPTVLIGGNHEAATHMFELFHGGYVAPDMYFLGHVGCVDFAGLRVAGISGIFKAYDVPRGYFERFPLDDHDKRSLYHQREFDARRIAKLGVERQNMPRRRVDLFLSHDWPTMVTNTRLMTAPSVVPSDSSADAEKTTVSESTTCSDHTADNGNGVTGDTTGADDTTGAVDATGDTTDGVTDGATGDTDGATGKQNRVTVQGDIEDLLRRKRHFADQVRRHDLGSPLLDRLLQTLRPRRWCAAHMHVRYVANVDFHQHKERTEFLALGKCCGRRQVQEYLDVLEFEVADDASRVLRFDEEWLAVVKQTAEKVPLPRYKNDLPQQDEFVAPVTPEMIDEVRQAFGGATGQSDSQYVLNPDEWFVASKPPADQQDRQQARSPPFVQNPQTAKLLRTLGVADVIAQRHCPEMLVAATRAREEAANPEEVSLDFSDDDSDDSEPSVKRQRVD
ncbi:MAG: hypothetical protein MHM6MM_001747 [Cercozoa sp. M6MM]